MAIRSGRVRVVGGAALIVLAVAALGPLLGTSDGAPLVPRQSVEGKSVILIDGSESNPWIAAYNRTFSNVLKAKGVEVSVLSNNFDSAVEAQRIDQAISLRPDLIAVGVQDANGVVAGFTRAKQAGIPVVIVVNPASARVVALSAGQFVDNHAALGRFAAMNIQQGLAARGLKRGNVIVITGSSSQLGVQLRLAAFRKQLAKTPGFKIVEVQDGAWDPVKSGQIAEQLFAKYANRGGVHAAYGMSDLMATAIARSAQTAGLKVGLKAKGLIVSGSNCGSDGIKAIKAGTLIGGATQAPTVAATTAAKQVLKVLAGQKVAKTVLVPEKRITRANVNAYAKICTY
jgi:ABC-type sugar transport system substrate-binding protein